MLLIRPVGWNTSWVRKQARLSLLLMKNIVKLFGIIALVTVIGFSMAACGGDEDGDAGSTIASGAQVAYEEGFPEESKSIGEFNWISDLDDSKKTVQLSKYIDNPTTVKITGGKLDIKLGKPKSAYLDSITNGVDDNLTVTPKDVKTFFIQEFCAIDDRYYLYCAKSVEEVAILLYVDKNVTVKGTADGEYDMSLKQGWNFMIVSEKTGKVTSSTTLPDGYKWTVGKANR